jgi:hypothetical protein
MKCTIKTCCGALLLTALLLPAACDTFSPEKEADYAEQPKDIAGTWQLNTVSRNGADITDAMDFSRFSIELKSDGSYAIHNYLPFIVRQNGTWRIDDPLYPFHLYFTESGSASEASTEIQFPIVNGKRVINITLSPGCGSNSYTYQFIKSSEQ